MTEVYRVAVWGPGSVGTAAIREVNLLPELQLVGVLAYNKSKESVDAGTLVGIEPLGVPVTTDVRQLLASKPDCVLYTARDYGDCRADDDIAILLEAGINVITALPYQYVKVRDADVFRRLEDAAKKGGSTLFGTGINPGFMFDRLAMLMTGMSNDIELIQLREYINCEAMPGAADFLRLMGFGMKQVDKHSTERTAALVQSYLTPCLRYAADRLGRRIDRIERDDNHENAAEDLVIPGLFTLQKGCVARVSHRWIAYSNGKPFLSTQANWYVTDKMRPVEAQGTDDCWIVEIEGRPSSRVFVELYGSLKDKSKPNAKNPSNTSFLGTVIPMIQAIPHVIEAEPGIMTSAMPEVHWRSDVRRAKIAPKGNGWDPLAEPELSRFLRVVRRELASTIAPELTSERCRHVLDMTNLLLDHLIVREEGLGALLQPHMRAELEALRVMQDALSRLGSDKAPVLEIFLNDDLPRDAARAQCLLAEQLELAIGAVVPRLRELPDEAAVAAWQAVKRAIQSEKDFHDAIEAQEKVVGVIDSGPQLGATEVSRERLEAYLKKRDPQRGAIKVEKIAAQLGGYSKDTFIVTLRGPGRPSEDVVIRRDLLQGPLEESVTSEFPVMKAMHDAGVPVAHPLWVETDPDVLGCPFLVMKRVPGKQLVDVKLDVAGEGTAECIRQLACVLAKIHSVDPRLAGIADSEVTQPTAHHIVRMLDKFEGQWLRRRMGPSPVIVAGFAWMRNNIPADLPPPQIVHGDPTVRNMLFEDGEAKALLDWETWHLGDPAEDLVYSRLDVDRFMSWQDYLAEYRKSGGAAIGPERERYWSMWLYLRGAVTSVSMMDRLLTDPPPDIRPAFGGPHFTRFCIRKVAEYMQSL